TNFVCDVRIAKTNCPLRSGSQRLCTFPAPLCEWVRPQWRLRMPESRLVEGHTGEGRRGPSSGGVWIDGGSPPVIHLTFDGAARQDDPRMAVPRRLITTCGQRRGESPGSSAVLRHHDSPELGSHVNY